MGTLLANLLPALYFPAAAELLKELQTALNAPGAARSGYFGYLLRIRLFPLLAVWFCLFGPYGAECLCVVALWYGICAGATLSGAVLICQMGGILIFFAAILPQYIFYTLIFLQLLAKQERRKNARYGQAVRLSDELSFLLVTAVLLLMGVLLEAYLNPIILRLVALVV